MLPPPPQSMVEYLGAMGRSPSFVHESKYFGEHVKVR
jgi:hypothetical protein